MQLLTGRDLRQTLKISRTTLFRLLKQGLPSVGMGRLRRFALDQVLRWLRERAGQDTSAEPQFYRAGLYRCVAPAIRHGMRFQCGESTLFTEPVHSDYFYCRDCASRDLEWVGLPYPQAAGESRG